MKRGKPERYLALAEQIRRMIRKRRLREADRLPSERQLAAQLGANHLTIRKALKVLEEQGLIHTVPSRGNFVGPKPVSYEDRPVVGILFPDADMFFFDILTQLETRLHAFGLHPVVHITNGAREKENEALDFLVRTGAAGVIAAPNEACGERYKRLDMPVVFFDAFIPGLAIPHVITDDYRGAQAAVEHLMSLGHSRIAHVGGTDATSEIRARAYADTLRRHGLSVDEACVRRRDYSRQWGYYAAEALFVGTPRPTALFCGNDTLAAGALRYLKAQGIRCPEQVSVVGFGNMPVALDLDLTTVSQPCSAIADAVWTSLRSLIEKKEAVSATKIATELIVRKTTARCG
ncbi:MAG: GntR family transcriptional regulator [Kiritimatiellae bacterium]|nr:GntR family transcriptional regulator [Kiritimatiellia bacterium]